MNKVLSDKYKECYYETTLENGLRVVIWHKEGYEKSFAIMATPMGAFDVLQIDSKGNEYTYHSGVAHFLEHKMFECAHRDVMEDFSRMGANVNAATTYDMTCYYFQTSHDLKEPLNLLLDFTQSLDIDEKSVEKEKGIIIQELNMYQQMSDFRLVRESFAALYHEHPLKYDVGGTTQSVNETTLDELKRCFHNNYHPHSMICVVITGKNPDEVMNIIENNQSSKKFANISAAKRKYIYEPKEVVKEHVVFEMDINRPKVNLAFKLKGITDPKERCRTELYLRFYFDALFSSINDEYQEWLDQEIINDFFGYEFDFGEDYGYCMLYSETDKIEEFKQMVFKQLKKMKSTPLKKEIFDQLKRRYYGENIRELNDFEGIAVTYIRNYFNQLSFFEVYDMIENTMLEDVCKAVDKLDLTHFSFIECQPLRG